MQPHEIIKQIPIFKTLSDSDLNDLVSSLRLKSLKQGQTLFWKGDEGTALYVVKKGTIKIVLPSTEGDEIIVTMFSEGDFFGEMALLDGEPRSADAVAIEPSEVFILSRTNFLSFLQVNVDAIKAILSMLSKRLRRTDDMLENTCFLNVSARLVKKLIELAESHGQKKDNKILIDLSLTQKELGDMVVATRESINKELKSLRKQGLIIIEGSRIQILDISRLKSKIF